MVYDTALSRTVLFGGVATIPDDGAVNAETWALSAPCVIPSVLTDPTARVACSGGAAGVSVNLSGSAPLAYQWQLQTPSGSWTPLGINPTAMTCGGAAWASSPNSAVTNVFINPCSTINHYQVRCVVTNPCGSATTNVAALTINSADFNGDGDTGTDQDIEAFFACLSGTCCPSCGSADFNGNGDIGTDQDIEAFFRVLAGGTC
jgi:hypothetical protein